MSAELTRSALIEAVLFRLKLRQDLQDRAPLAHPTAAFMHGGKLAILATQAINEDDAYPLHSFHEDVLRVCANNGGPGLPGHYVLAAHPISEGAQYYKVFTVYTPLTQCYHSGDGPLGNLASSRGHTHGHNPALCPYACTNAYATKPLRASLLLDWSKALELVLPYFNHGSAHFRAGLWRCDIGACTHESLIINNNIRFPDVVNESPLITDSAHSKTALHLGTQEFLRHLEQHHRDDTDIGRILPALKRLAALGLPPKLFKEDLKAAILEARPIAPPSVAP